MSSRPFDRLPYEVLLRVFIKGVEGDRLGVLGSCRRLKTFARLARQVCARWRTIIDNPPSSVSFWIAYLVLTTHYPGDRKGQSFAKQLATFHHLLLSSNGCDLAIIVNLFSLDEEMHNDISYPYTSSIVRLAIYAMEMITPYHNQAIELGVYNVVPVVHLYLLKWVATRWTNTSRLLVVAFSGITNMPSELSLSSLPGYKKILSKTSKGVSSPLSLARFRNLDTLTIPVGLWIKWGVLLPPYLQSLTLGISGDVTLAKLFAFLQTQINLLDSLRSIRIEKPVDAAVKEIDEQEEAKRPTGQLLGRINLPLLRSISLDKLPLGDVLDFLRTISCRSLESLWIELTGLEDIDQSSLSIDSPSEFPRLTSTELGLNVKSWQSLHYLEMFTGLPIQQLQVSFWNYEPDWIDHLVSFRITLSSLRLQELTMEAPYWVSHYLLASLDTQNLTRLDIRLTYLNLERFPPMDRDPEILAPHLKELKFDNSEDHLIHFLSHLEATQLVNFEYTGYRSASTDWDREKALQALSTKSFASVRSAYLYLSRVDQFLPHLVHLFPNLDQLRIRIESGDDDVMDDDAIPHLIRDVIQPLCDALVLLPYLCSISADCYLDIGGLSQSTAKWSDVTREEVQRMLQRMLTSLAKAGGLPLQMGSIKFEDGSEYGKTRVKFEAREAPSLIETNSP